MSEMNLRKPNADQLKVINELDSNLILFASAGTGKTYTVAQRVNRIIETGKASPEAILCLTFTIKAASEMKEDILHYAGEAGSRVDTRTIHSFAYQVLKEESLLNPEYYGLPGICDETGEIELLKRIVRECGLPEDAGILKSDTALTSFVRPMKYARESLQMYSEDEVQDFTRVYQHIRAHDPKQYDRMLLFYDYAWKKERRDEAFVKLMDQCAGQFLHSYNQTLRQNDLLDFDDLICLTHRLFRDETALKRWRSKYRYIIVDEMQDTSELEYDTLQQIFHDNNVMMCGDFFQTIYQWRGSDPEKVLGAFVRDFHAKRFMFAENYRSTRMLTKASFGYLKNTYPEMMGVYCPPEVIPRSQTEGEPILNVRLGSPEAEALWIYNYLEKHRPEDVTKVCIMARSNPYIAQLYDQLARISSARANGSELRFFSIDKDAKFFRREVIRDILSVLRILVNPTDALGFERVVVKYVSGVGEKRIRQVRGHSELGLSLASFADEKLYRDGDPYAALMKAFHEGSVVIYDTETTGLDLHHDQIIQIAAIRLNAEGQITDRLNRYVIPTVEISEGAIATHHLTLEEIVRRGGIDIRTALREFLAFCDGAVLVGHNSLRFDAPLLQRQLQENGLPMPGVIAEYDTLPIAQQLLPKSVNYKLETLCGTFGIVNEEAHDAMGDITATGQVLKCLLRKYVIPKTEERRQYLAQWRPKFERIHAFLSMLRKDYLDRNDVAGLVQQIVDTLGLRTRYSEAIHQRTLEDFLYALRQAEYDNALWYLRDLLADAALSGSQMDMLIRKLRKIPIITVHQSKGCEFDTVIIAGADDDNFPTFQAKVHNTLEEEKRVFYVAISRARRTLILTSVTQRVNRGGSWPVEQSRWIQKIPRAMIRTITV